MLAALPLGMALAAPEAGAVDLVLEAGALSATSAPDPAQDAAMTVVPFSRYEIILARKPFGSTPPAAAAAAPAADAATVQQAQDEQKLASQINVVAINKTPSGNTAVGFIDKSEKPERNCYIAVGETNGEFTVVAASYEEETVTLRKGAIEITLKLGQGLIKGGAPQALPAAASGRAPVPPSVRVPPAITPPPPAITAPPPELPPAAAGALRTLNSESFRERLARQRSEREAAEAARQKRAQLDAEARAEKITKEELEKATREININLIRQGMKPISPVTLTPEEDAEMVRLGVFDAQ